MAQGFLTPLPERLFDANGAPAVGWKVATFTATGTFSTPLTTYSDSALLSANTNPIITDANGYYACFVAAGVILDVQVKNAADVLQFTQLSIKPMDLQASTTFVNPVVTGGAGTGFMVAKRVTFTEDATSVTHTATIPLAAGTTLHDIQIDAGVLWTAAAAVMKVGDTADDDGYFIGVNLKSADLLVGEQLSLRTSETWGGKQGVYLVAATGRRGPVATNFGGKYLAGSNILITITVTTPATTVGRTYATVLYSAGETIAPVLV